jgi:hypothetical protein
MSNVSLHLMYPSSFASSEGCTKPNCDYISYDSG